MKRILLAAAAIAPLAACTYVDERPGYAPTAYAPAPAATYGYAAPPPAYAYRGGSYEAERQAYEYGRRDGAAAARGWR
jgi:hypothetical protein